MRILLRVETRKWVQRIVDGAGYNYVLLVQDNIVRCLLPLI
jgi:hypothetical protein